MVKTRKSLWAAGFALLVCIALLIGTTFAWFTDSITNSGNKIQAGNLQIKATAYDLDNTAPGSGFTIEGVNGGEAFNFEATGTDLESAGPIISESLWEPGKSSAKLLKVENAGTLAAKIKLEFDTAGELTDALWFDFVQVEDGTLSGQFTKRPMNTLETFAQTLELPLLKNGDNVQFILVYGMNESAGNEYQGKSFEANVTILATQEKHEADGFGNDDYDAGAKYDAVNGSQISEALTNGGNAVLAKDISLTTSINMTGDTKSELNLNGNTMTMTSDGIIDLSGNAEITISNGIIEQNMQSEIGYICRAAGDSHVVIESGTYIGGLTCVQAGDNAVVEIKGGHFEALVDWNGTYWLLNLIDSSNAKIIVTGGTFVNFDPSNSQTENPTADFVAKGYTVTSEKQANGDIWYTVVPE